MATPAIPEPTVEVLQYAGVPKNQIDAPLGQLLRLCARRYGLDPAPGRDQIEVIKVAGAYEIYITADGYRTIAARSGQLDGITFPDVSEGEHGWRATCHVWLKDCGHPFEGRAGCGFEEKQQDPEATAMTRATRRALKNAFEVPVIEELVGHVTNNDGAEPSSEPQGWDIEAGAATGGAAGQRASTNRDAPPGIHLDDPEGGTQELPGPQVSPRLEGYPLTGDLVAARDWWTERCHRAGVPVGRLVARARQLAMDRGLAPVRSVDDIADPTLISACLDWLAEEAIR